MENVIITRVECVEKDNYDATGANGKHNIFTRNITQTQRDVCYPAEEQ